VCCRCDHLPDWSEPLRDWFQGEGPVYDGSVCHTIGYSSKAVALHLALTLRVKHTVRLTVTG